MEEGGRQAEGKSGRSGWNDDDAGLREKHTGRRVYGIFQYGGIGLRGHGYA